MKPTKLLQLKSQPDVYFGVTEKRNTNCHADRKSAFRFTAEEASVMARVLDAYRVVDISLGWGIYDDGYTGLCPLRIFKLGSKIEFAFSFSEENQQVIFETYEQAKTFLDGLVAIDSLVDKGGYFETVSVREVK